MFMLNLRSGSYRTRLGVVQCVLGRGPTYSSARDVWQSATSPPCFERVNFNPAWNLIRGVQVRIG